ncbi:MAG: hypothetical protein FD135_3638 [Comamonadaceae bacterium]|nr:MAG: hypothetical protein FD135_3638 [Comamonadaceae bacterium]
MKTEKVLLATTILAAASLARSRLVDYAGAPCGAGVRALGSANANYDAGEFAGVNTHGELVVEAGAAVAVGEAVQSDATARVVPLTTGVEFGAARDAATAAGDFIRVLV